MMDEEKFVNIKVWVLSASCGILLAIVSYFGIRLISQQERQGDKINQMQIDVAVIKEQVRSVKDDQNQWQKLLFKEQTEKTPETFEEKKDSPVNSFVENFK